MYRSRIHGFGLVELMVAVVIGLIGSIIIFQVFAAFEGQKRSTTAGGDVQTNIAIATNAIETAARHAGYGINFKSHLGCDAVVWSQNADPTLVPLDQGRLSIRRLVPANIEREVSGELRSLTFLGASSDSTYAVTKLGLPMADTESHLRAINLYSIDQGDVLILAEKKDPNDAQRRDKITCTVTDVRNLLPPGAPRPVEVDHTFGAYTRPDSPAVTRYTRFNKPGGLGSIPSGVNVNELNHPDILKQLDLPFANLAPTQFRFSSNASITNMGRSISGTNIGLRASKYEVRNGQLLENEQPIVDGIVFMEAQYGKAPSATSTAGTVSYIKTMPETPNRDPKISQSDWFSLRTVRVVLIARVGQYEKDYTSPPSFTIWGAPDPHNQPVTYTVPPSDRNYRHKVVELVIPLRNMFWTPQ